MNTSQVISTPLEKISSLKYTMWHKKASSQVNSTEIANVFLEVQAGIHPLTKMVIQKTAKRAFVANKKGSIFIYDISPVDWNFPY